MTTNKKVDFFESQNDDSEWGAPVKVSRAKKPKSVMVSVRFTAEEFKLIQEAADEANLSISALIRVNVLNELVKQLPRGSSAIRTTSSLSGNFYSVSENRVTSTHGMSTNANIGFQSGKLVSN